MDENRRLSLLSAVTLTANRMNNERGYGTISQVRLYLDGQCEFTVRSTHMRDAVRRGRVRNGRLFFLNTSRKLP